MLKSFSKIFIMVTLALALVFSVSAPKQTDAASLHFKYYAHTLKKAPYHKSKGSKKVLGHISKNQLVVVFSYSKSWYTIKLGNKYVYVYKKYLKKGEYIAPKLKGKVIQSKDGKWIILPDGGKIFQYPDGKTYSPDPSEGGSKEPVALQVAQAQAIQLGTGNIEKHSDGTYIVIVPMKVIASDGKKYGGKFITYANGSFAIYYPHLKKKKNGSYSYYSPTESVEVTKFGQYSNISAPVVLPKNM